MYKKLGLLFCLTALFQAHAFTQNQMHRRTRLDPRLAEISGMTRSPDGRFWALNDGGNPAVLFGIDPSSGRVKDTIALPIPNHDWEDLAGDPAGNLYIADIGNNQNNRRNLCIYRFQPDSRSLDSIRFAYPDQQAFPPGTEDARNFDCEAMIWYRDSLHLFTKSRFKGLHYTKHYVLPARPGVQKAILLDSLYLAHRVVSGAGLSDDGRTLALTAYIVKYRRFGPPKTRATAFFLSDYPEGRFLQAKAIKRKRLPRCLVARQFESILHWSGGVWLAANEKTPLHRPRLWKVHKPAKRR